MLRATESSPPTPPLTPSCLGCPQAERWGAELYTEDVESVDLSTRPFTIRSADRELRAHSIVIATGATAKRLGLPSEQAFWGKVGRWAGWWQGRQRGGVAGSGVAPWRGVRGWGWRVGGGVVLGYEGPLGWVVMVRLVVHWRRTAARDGLHPLWRLHPTPARTAGHQRVRHLRRRVAAVQEPAGGGGGRRRQRDGGGGVPDQVCQPREFDRHVRTLKRPGTVGRESRQGPRRCREYLGSKRSTGHYGMRTALKRFCAGGGGG